MLAMRNRRSGSWRSTRRFRGLQLQPLEERALLAVTSQYTDGLLTVRSDGQDDIFVTTAGGDAKVNDQNPTGGRVSADQVNMIQFAPARDSQIIDVSGIDRQSFPSVEYVAFAGGPWLEPGRVDDIAEEILGPGWAKRLSIPNVEEYLTNGDWKQPLAGGSLAKQMTDAGWGNAQGLLDRIVAESDARARVRFAPVTADAGLGFDVLFNGRWKDAALQTAEPATSPEDMIVTPFSGGEGDPKIYLSSSAITEPANPGVANQVFMHFGVIVEDAYNHPNPITFTWTTIDGTAIAPGDYAVTTNTFTFAPNETSGSISVAVFGDHAYEPSETFQINITSVNEAELQNSSATGTIYNNADDTAPALSISASPSPISEPTFTGETANVVFTVQRVPDDQDPTQATTTFVWSTENISATAGSDYNAVTSATVTFAPSQSAVLLTVAVRGDALDEQDESFKINLTNVTHAAATSYTATESITDTDNPMPSLSIADNTVSEGGQLVFTVSLSGPMTDTPVSFVWSTANGTATAGADYTGVTSTTETFAANTTVHLITVATLGDGRHEFDETFQVNLTGLVGATAGDTSATGTITSADPRPVVGHAFSEADEDGVNAVVTVKLSNASDFYVYVPWVTVPGTATSSDDYSYATGTMTFAPGSTTTTITVPIANDNAAEADELFYIDYTGGNNVYRDLDPEGATVRIYDADLSTVVFADEEFHVNENVAVGAKVGAIDVAQLLQSSTLAPDFGPVRLEVLSGSGMGKFSVDSLTGEIFVIGSSPDYEAAQSYTLLMKASGSWDSEAWATATITIHIDPVNEAPIVSSAGVEVNEDITTLDITVPVDDQDVGDQRLVSIVSGDPLDLFDILPTGGSNGGALVYLKSGKSLNYELTRKHELLVKIRDQQGLYGTATVTIRVDNVTEPPEIHDQGFEILENSPGGTVVGQLTAIADKDRAITAFTVSGWDNSAGVFTLDTNGRIKVANGAQLDYEGGTREYTFTYVAHDDLSQMSTAKTVTIKVTNVNEAPTLTANGVFEVDENSPHGTVVGQQFIIGNLDDGESVALSIKAGNSGPLGPGVFAIDPVTKQLYVADPRQLNFEVTQSYTLVIEARDSGTGRLVDSELVIVTVNNVEEAPVARGGKFSISAPDAPDSINGFFVGEVLVDDEDINDGFNIPTLGSSTWTFAIISGNTSPTAAFAISSLGQITVANTSALRTIAGQEVNLLVRVSDMPNTLFAETTVTIVVDETLVPPSITLSGTVRDFHKNTWPPAASATTVGHPDFESTNTGKVKGLVQSTLGADNTPILASEGSNAIQSVTSFSTWYHDNSLYNMKTSLPLIFTAKERTFNGQTFTSYWFEDTTFFPIDGQLFNEPGTDNYEQPYNDNHNFHFTMELHASFTYRRGTGQLFQLTESDDDLWLFINKQLVVDIGGIHGHEGGGVNLDAISDAIGLVDRQTYDLDFFFAERHTSASDLIIFTTIQDLKQTGASGYFIREDDLFESTIEDATPQGGFPIEFVVPANPQAVAFTFHNLSFDLDDPDSINDAFELALVDVSGKSVVPTIGFGREAFFNATEEQPLRLANDVTIDAHSPENTSTVYVDISHLMPGTRLTLVTRLVNNDGLAVPGSDAHTQVYVPGDVKFVPLPFSERGGMVVAEAEHFTGEGQGAAVAENSDWQVTSDALARGGQAVIVPNASVSAGNSTVGPRLDYAINFATTGVYYVWIRGKGPDSNGDSVHVGLDGALLYANTTDVTFGTNYIWKGASANSSRLQFNVTTPGIHRLNLWMKEDGASVDRFLLTTSETFTPSEPSPQESPRAIVTAPAAPGAAVFPAAPVAADFSLLSDVTAGYDFDYGVSSWNDASRVLFADLKLTNNGRFAVRGDTGPLLVGVTNISSPLVSLANPDGVTPDGMPYYDISRLAFTSGDVLSESGHVVNGLTLKFRNPTEARFSYDLVVLGARNRSPEFISTPRTEVNPGSYTGYAYDLVAEDADVPDQPALVYSVLVGPAWLSIDPDNRMTIASQSAPAAGNYSIVLKVVDPLGAFDLQSFVLHVSASNRPPQFRSVPIVDAYAGEDYKYQAFAVDPEGQTLEYSAFEMIPPPPNFPGTFEIIPGTGEVTWTIPETAWGQTVPVKLKVTDTGGLFDDQEFDVYIHPARDNRPPVITSEPALTHYLPAPRQASLDPVSPTSLAFSLADEELTTKTVSLFAGTGTRKADIVFIVDESTSMDIPQGWLADSIGSLQTELTGRGITAANVNFGLVGFGSLANTARAITFSANPLDVFGDANELADAIRGLGSSGRLEDGYYAIDFALAKYTFRSDAVVSFVLVTDEDRDAYFHTKPQGAPAVTFADIANKLKRSAETVTDDIVFNAILSGTLYGASTGGDVLDDFGNPSEWTAGPFALSPSTPGTTAVLISQKTQPAELDSFQYAVETAVTLAGGYSAANGYVIFDYQGVNDFKFGGVDVASNRYVFGYKDALGWHTFDEDPIIPQTELEFGETYSLSLWTMNGTSGNSKARLIVDGVEVGTHEYGDALGGRFGLATQQSAATFSFFRHGLFVSSAPLRYPNEADGYLLLHATDFGGTQALGIDAQGTAYLPNGNTEDIGQFVSPGNFSTQNGSTWIDYALLAWQSGGSVWDVNYLRSGNQSVKDTFRSAFVNIVVGDLQYPLGGATLRLSDPELEGKLNFQFDSQPEDGTFDISFTGDGRAHNFEIEFVDNGNVLASIPVAITSAYSYDLKARDPDGDAVSFAWTDEDPDNGAHLDANGKFYWNPTEKGFYRFSVTASDGRGGTDVQEWTVEVKDYDDLVNTSPVIEETVPLPAFERRDWRFEVQASDADVPADALRYYLVNHPGNNQAPPQFMAIDRNTGVVRWQPADDGEGTYYFGVVVADGRGGEATAGFTVQVGAETVSNHDPQFDSLPVEIVVAEEQYLYHAHANDADGDAILYSLAAGPNGMVVDPITGDVAWKPGYDDLGPHDVVIAADDGHGGRVTQAFRLEVVEINSAPVFKSQPLTRAGVGHEWEYELKALDPNGDDVDFRLDVAPDGMEIVLVDGKYIVRWTPGSGTEGHSYRVKILADDGRGGVTPQEFSLSVTENAPPRLTVSWLQTATVGQQYVATINTSDDDNDVVTVTIDRDSYDRGMRLVQLSEYVWQLRWTPSIVGRYKVTVKTADADGPGEFEQIEALVRAASGTGPELPNVAPEITSNPPVPAVRFRNYTYPVIVDDPDSDPSGFSYLLDSVSSSLGMSIVDGVLTWMPLVSGTYRVQVTVLDGDGGRDYQAFDLPVLDNTPPRFTEAPVTRIAVDAGPYSYLAAAYDPDPKDEGKLVYSLNDDSSHPGMTIDAATGQIEWVLDNVAPDVYPVTVTVVDADNAAAILHYDLQVYEPVVPPEENEAPVFTERSEYTIRAGDLYEYQIKAHDPEGDPLRFELVNSVLGLTPPGLTMDDHGLVRWQTTFADVNLPNEVYKYGVRVVDAHDYPTQLNDYFFIRVVAGPAPNAAPYFTSVPLGGATVGEQYKYPATAFDPDLTDRLELRFSLVSGPVGMSIDPVSGLLIWTPTASQLGSHDVLIRVADDRGESEQQGFTLDVRQLNVPPNFESFPDDKAVVGVQYVYDIVASDMDDDFLTIELLNGVTFTGDLDFTHVAGAKTARLEWTPSTPGAQEVRLRLSDGEAERFYTYTINVSSNTANNVAPTITTTPPMIWKYGVDYTVDFDATDDGPPALHWSLDYGITPVSVGIDETSGLLTWDDPPVGNYTIAVIVQDDDGNGRGSQIIFPLKVFANTAPVITAVPQSTITAGQLFKYNLKTTDPDVAAGLDSLQYSLDSITGDPVNDPTIDEFGRITWQSTAADKDKTFTFDVTVTDQYGGTDTENISIHADADDNPPVVEVYADYSVIQVGRTVTFLVRAYDDVDGPITEDLTLTVGGVNYQVDATGRVPVVMDPLFPSGNSTTVTFHASATDSADNVGISADSTLIVYKPIVEGNEPPIAMLTAPASDFTIRETVDVFGVVDDPDATDQLTYSVSLMPMGATDPSARIDLGSFAGRRGDSDPLTTAALGAQIDPSALANGSYWLELVVHDGMSMRQSASQLITIDSQFKLGNFNLSFTDFQSQVAGLPVTVRRTYDSLRANESSDFGYGWSLDLFTGKLDIQLSDNPNNAYWQGLGYEPALFAGSRMVVNLPGGKTLGFTAVPMPTDDGTGFGAGGVLGFADIFALGFLPDEGNLARLDLAGYASEYFYPKDYIDSFDEFLFGEPYQSFAVVLDPTTNEFREVTIGAQSTLGIPKNPASFGYDYRLTLPDLSVYVFDSKTGELLSYTDPDKNRLLFAGENLTSVSPDGEVIDSIAITRDSYNRITHVTDSGGKSIVYAYDPATGDLASVTNRVGESTSFEYDVATTHRPHFLTRIIDARGVPVLSASFDQATGRLTTLQDAAGGSAGFEYSLDLGDGRTLEKVTDANNSPTEIVRDRDGNVERRVQRVFTGADVGEHRYLVTVYRYDANDHQTHASIPFEVTGENNRLAAGADFVSDPLDPAFDRSVWQSISVYDDDGHLLTTTDTLGHATSYGNYDRFGNPQTITDPIGRTTTNVYDDGRLLETIDAAGGLTKFAYNDAGRLWQVAISGVDIEPLTTMLGYDNKGRVVYSIDPAGVVDNTIYCACGKPISYFNWDDPTTGDGFIGDGIIDAAIVTRTFYDDEDRVTGTAQYTLDEAFFSINQLEGLVPDWTTTIDYDSAGLVTKRVDRYGIETYTLYDLRGDAVETRTRTLNESGQPRWRVARTAYDANGRVEATMDPLVVVNSYAPTDAEFDLGDDQIETASADYRVSQTIYDAAGRVIETRRLAGVEIALSEVTEEWHTTRIYSATYAEPTDLITTIRSREQTRYDSAGNVTETIVFNTTDATDPFGTVLNHAWFQYDDAGRQTAVIQAVDLNHDGSVDVTYDAAGVPVGGSELVRTSTMYDAAGQVQTAISATQIATRYEYDAAGRVIRTISDVGGLEIASESRYDALGRKIAEINPYELNDPPAGLSTITTTYVYDDLGRLAEVVLPQVSDDSTGSTIGQPIYLYDYDRFGNQTSISDPQGHTTRFTYDAFGRQLTRTLPDALQEEFVYDVHGRQILHVDFQGRYIRNLYDATTGRLTAEHYFADETAYDNGNGLVFESVSYTYDPLGRVATTTGSLGSVSYKYDADGRITQLQSDQGYINYAYNKLGQLTRTWSSTNDTGVVAITGTNFRYDSLGRLIEVAVTERNASPTSEATEYRYDANGNLDLEIRPGQIVTDYQYDALNRLKVLVNFVDGNDNGVYDDGPTALLGQFVYSLRADGMREKVVETDDQNETTTIDWVYDELGRLVEERYNSFDDDLDYIARYGFDLASNRILLEKDLQNAASQSFSADETTSYLYDVNDRLTRETFTGQAASTTTFYDYNGTEQSGQTIYDGIHASEPATTPLKSTVFRYNLQGRLSQVTVDDGSTVTVTSYNYNADGIRVEQTVQVDAAPATTTIYHIDPFNQTGYAQVLEAGVDANADGRLQAGEIAKTYTLGLAVIAQHDPNVESGETLYLLRDGHGSTRALVTDAGEIVQSYDYDAYGNAEGFDPASAYTSLLYNAEWFDVSTGMNYFRRRWYQPTTGRFNRLDEFVGDLYDPLSFHKYLFTHANPIMGIDPLGLAELVSQITVSNISTSMRASLNSAIQQAGKRIVSKVVCEAAEEAVFQGIYIVIFNGIPYVGQSGNIAQRIAGYKSRLGKGFEGVIGILKVIPGVDAARAQKFVRELVEQVVMDIFADSDNLPDLKLNSNRAVSLDNFERRATKHLGKMTKAQLKAVFDKVADFCK